MATVDQAKTAPDEAAPAATDAGQAASPGGRFGGFGPTANILLGYTFVKGLQLSAYNLLFPLYAYSLGYDQAVIGQLNAIVALTVLVVSVPLGMLADRYGRARTLALSAMFLPLFIAGIGLSRSLPLLVVTIVLQNGISTLYWSTTSALLVGAVPQEQRVRVFALNSFLLWSLGALGSVLGGLVASTAARVLGVGANDTAPLRAALLVGAAVILLGGLPLWRLREVAIA